MRAGLKAVQRWCDEVAGDTLARGHVDKGENRVDQLIGWPVGQTKAFRALRSLVQVIRCRCGCRVNLDPEPVPEPEHLNLAPDCRDPTPEDVCSPANWPTGQLIN